jgi:hypothetical protein
MVTERFLEHRKPYAAVETLALYADRAVPRVPAALISRALKEAGTSPPAERVDLALFGHGVVELLDRLYEHDEVDEHILAELEWLFLYVLEQQGRSPRVMHRELSRSPGLFAEVVDLVYQPDSGEEPDLSEAELQRVLQADELLRNWHIVPGTTEEGALDQGKLDAWVSEARVATTARGRARSADRCIGRVLAASPEGADGAWPHEAVRTVIDRLDSDDVDEAFRSQVINSRGVYSKGYLEGGGEEREMAEKYRSFADASSFRWPRTAAVLEEVAEIYDSWALRRDAEAELREDS